MAILTSLPWDLADPLPERVRALLALGPEDPPLVVHLSWTQRAVAGQGPGLDGLPAAMTQLLNGAELARLAAFRQPQDRWRHGLARAGLKQLLGQVLGLEPLALEIQAGHRGKPRLVPSSSLPSPPQFNGSHAGDLVVLALHPSLAVGVDTERLDRRVDWTRLAPRWFPDQQGGVWQAGPQGDQHVRLLRQWCRLEAQLKCSGEGLAGLQALRRALAERPPLTTVGDLALPEGYCGALAWAQPADQPVMQANSASTEA